MIDQTLYHHWKCLVFVALDIKGVGLNAFYISCSSKCGFHFGCTLLLKMVKASVREIDSIN